MTASINGVIATGWACEVKRGELLNVVGWIELAYADAMELLLTQQRDASPHFSGPWTGSTGR
jgi:hypothetical protein